MALLIFLAVNNQPARRIVEAGRLTGSSMNGQPWHFIVMEKRETLRQLGGLVQTGPYVVQAPLAIVVALENTKYAVSDASRAIQSMISTAWADRVGSNWVGFMGLTGVKPLLGLPDGLRCWRLSRLAIRYGLPVRVRNGANYSLRWLTASGSVSPLSEPYAD